ncbi:MAG: UDP-N-acetyl glucosamine 2-epimerase [Deltaproteobacteria bacterium]|nr:UDP-N-acetyl glucosamine 2-epimerase [Deltaproteobacteria bacterium]
MNRPLIIVTIVGARPQFIKAAPVGRAIRQAGHREILVHTGQHYDDEMSRVFFQEMGIPEPDHNLGIGSGSHGYQTGEMLKGIEDVLIQERPDCVLVFGDTNSTVAGALAAVKLHIPIAHVEAGLRSYNREMPEEHNRVLTDHCADILFCPTETAVRNLQKEGFTGIVNNGKCIDLQSDPVLSHHALPLVVNVGDTMYDAVLQFGEIARRTSTVLDALKLESGRYFLATLHRPYNVDIPEHLENILAAFIELEETVLFPVHPRTRKQIAALNMAFLEHLKKSTVKLVNPVGYLDMLVLEQNARAVLTDSGGMQKEAYFFGVPCITLRPETEWVETVDSGWNTVVGTDKALIIEKAASVKPSALRRVSYGDGRAAEKIVHTIATNMSNFFKKVVL